MSSQEPDGIRERLRSDLIVAMKSRNRIRTTAIRSALGAIDNAVRAAIRHSTPGLTPVLAFFHADIKTEESMRQQFRRVYICRRYERPVNGAS